MQNSKLKQVESFWSQNICGSSFVNKPFGTKEFFEEYIRFRYEKEWHLNYLVPFDKYNGKKVLEIGCGMGADGRRFTENGAIYTGIDLSKAVVNTAQKHFQLYDLPGVFQVENAENMSFADETFDLVYAHGVLHHTPNINKIHQGSPPETPKTSISFRVCTFMGILPTLDVSCDLFFFIFIMKNFIITYWNFSNSNTLK